jgi:alpha-tubulin suppressor-like RCC1 family protein
MSSQASMHSIVIKDNGDAFSMGYNYYGQLGQTRNNRNGNPNYPQVINGLSNIKQIAEGYYHSLILLGNGDLYSMGYNYYGQLGYSTGFRTDNSYPTPTLIMSDVKEVACGYIHSVVLKNNGDVHTFGYNAYGQLGRNGTSDDWSPARATTGAKSIGAGYLNSYYIAQDTKLYGAGYSNYGELMVATGGNANSTFRYMRDNIKQVDGGIHFTLMLTTDNIALACGYNYYGQLGTSTNINNGNANPTPRQVLTNVRQVTAGGYSAYYLTLTGDLHTVGYNDYGQLGNGSVATVDYTLKKVRSGVRQVSAGYYHSMVLDAGGSVYAAGYNNYGNLGVTNNASTGTPNPTYLYVMNGVKRLMGGSNTPFTLSAVTLTTSFHKDDVTLTLNIDHITKDLASYRILVNSVQRFPTTGWTAPQITDFIMTKSLPHSYFNLGANTVSLEVQDSLGSIEINTWVVTKTNIPPSLSPLLSAAQIHRDNVTVGGEVTDTEGDKVQYRVLLNNVQKYPSSGFTELEPTPANIGVVINNSDFNVGSNTLKIEAKDDLGVLTTWTQVIIKTNTAPSITGTVLGNFISAQVTDSDTDKVQYRIILNGTQLYPEVGYTGYNVVPLDIKYTIPKSLVKKKVNNTVRIETLDELGGAKAVDIIFVGVYSGLLFCDATETFYSDDFGEVLKYLDFGTMVAGQTTAAERVFIKNTLGYPVENVRVWVDQRELDGTNAKAEISKLDAPFESYPQLLYMEQVDHNAKISFYVRIVTNRQAMWGGMFDVLTKADPKQS